MKAGEHREDKEGECFVRFGHGGGLTPPGITVKVRTCEEGKCTPLRRVQTYSNSPCPLEWTILAWYDN
jgi:hypothetical protein